MMVPVFLRLLVFLLLQPLQLGLVHHFLDQVFLSAHPVTQVLGKARDQVCDQGLDGKDQVLQKQRKDITRDRCFYRKKHIIFMYMYYVPYYVLVSDQIWQLYQIRNDV